MEKYTMNWRKYFCALLIPIFSILVFLSPASALDNDAARASLRGIEAIRLIVEELIPEIVKDGLTSDQIYSAVEQQLREVGIKVVADDKIPFLLVSPSIAKFGRNNYVYTVKAELYQVVIPYRFLPEKEGSSSLQNALFASTWGSPGGIGATPNLQDVKPSIKAEVARFIEGFREANR
jgi:hypothetical protein